MRTVDFFPGSRGAAVFAKKKNIAVDGVDVFFDIALLEIAASAADAAFE